MNGESKVFRIALVFSIMIAIVSTTLLAFSHQELLRSTAYGLVLQTTDVVVEKPPFTVTPEELVQLCASQPSKQTTGRQLKLQSVNEQAPVYDMSSSEIYGSNIIELGRGYDPRLSPDGTRVLYGNIGSLEIINLDGSNHRVLTTPWVNGEDGNPMWSPSGELIAFVRWSGASSDDSDLFTIRPDGSHLTKITVPQFHPNESVLWSPDEESLAFVSDERFEDAQMFIARTLTLSDNRLHITFDHIPMIEGEYVHEFISWTEDGSKLSYSSIIENTRQTRVFSWREDETLDITEQCEG